MIPATFVNGSKDPGGDNQIFYVHFASESNHSPGRGVAKRLGEAYSNESTPPQAYFKTSSKSPASTWLPEWT